ncbi:MAG: hypothetical protein JO307_24310 [Bryobacterales bacterium]|nr:hypothetical protein [Bryobacterales bacterium]
MRTTLTLDDDVAALLHQVHKERKGSFKDVINAALRAGLVAMSRPPQARKPFRTHQDAHRGAAIAGKYRRHR